MSLRNFTHPAVFASLALGIVAALPAFADPIDPTTDTSSTTRRTRVVQTPAPVVTTPVVNTPPPTPTVTNPTPTGGTTTPPPANVPTGPIFLGSATDLAQQPTLSSVFSRLNSQIDLYNASAANDLPDADLGGARQVVPVVAPVVTQPVVTTPPPVVEPQTQTSSDGTTRRTRVVSTPPVIIPPPAPTTPSITEITVDITGWSYIVLKWGDVNHHYYVGDMVGSQTFRGSAPLASYSFFQAQVIPIAEGGSTLLLLTGAVGALAYLRRRRRIG
ncbi:MAG: hypothetical protein JNN01_02590 [Opitutaceae bacterium]|nr:hypothetical protein [Opitutaceae bacterium]